LYSMGVGGILCSLLAVIAATLVVPAALALVGDHLDLLVPRRLRQQPGHAPGDRFWGQLARGVMRRPVLILLVASAVLLVVASPARRIEFGGADASVLGAETDVRRVDSALRGEF